MMMISKKEQLKYYLLTDEAFKSLLANQINNLNHFTKLCQVQLVHTTQVVGRRQLTNQMLQHFGTRLYLDVEFVMPTSDFRISQMEPLSIGKEIAVDITAFLEKNLTATVS